MPSAELIAVARFMPERVVENGARVAVRADKPNPFFGGIDERRFASPEHTSASLGAHALRSALEHARMGADELDLVIASAMLTDVLGTGIASAVQHEVGASRAAAINVDTNCTSYLSSLNVARAFIESGRYRNVAVVTATNFVSRMSGAYADSAATDPLGDGASATILTAGERSFLASHERSFGQHYGALAVRPAPVSGEGPRHYWEPHAGPLHVHFTPEMLDALMTNALKSVPRAITTCLEEAGLTANDVSLLVTHQPNRFFVDEWRLRMGIPAERSHDTLRIHGNLFQSSIPVNLAHAVEEGKLRAGDIVALGAFANAGDIVSAAVLRWSPRASPR